MNDQDHIYMQRAFELARLGMGTVSPNPMVGCVIVHQDTIIGEGWHRQYGQGHAEVNAIKSVENPDLLKEATVYVTLEPCAHHGKTPPCADLLITHQVKKVVVANKDPFPLVNGGGINKLKQANIDVEVGLLEATGRELNKRFFCFQEKKRPYIILKWAQTTDGFVARQNFDSKWISNSESRRLVHKWRAEEDAILVGTNTARYDNPTLNVRDWQGKHPLRLVIDKHLTLDKQLHLFDQSIPTVCYNLHKDGITKNLEFKKISERHSLADILADLYERKIQSLIVEGGSNLLATFIEGDLWDEARIFTAPTSFGSGIPAPNVAGTFSHKKDIRGDMLSIISNK
jgi:diaminohydroxyphosphoribosylaminopyrimidine deaminase/5-amino-6-(5-phosphoribosylamino)uracil reductase